MDVFGLLNRRARLNRIARGLLLNRGSGRWRRQGTSVTEQARAILDQFAPPMFDLYCIIVWTQPWQAVFSVEYLELIFRAYVDYPGHTWLIPNEAFRMSMAIHSKMCGDEPDMNLWLRPMTPESPILGERLHRPTQASMRQWGRWVNPACTVGSVTNMGFATEKRISTGMNALIVEFHMPILLASGHDTLKVGWGTQIAAGNSLGPPRPHVTGPQTN